MAARLPSLERNQVPPEVQSVKLRQLAYVKASQPNRCQCDALGTELES